MNEKRILKNYILYLLTGLLICFFGISNIFADTIIDTSTWITYTGVKWSITGAQYSGNPNFNNDWLLNNYLVSTGTYVNSEWNYIEFSYFENTGGTFNPCNSDSKFSASFQLLFTSPGIVDQVHQVKWGNDNCAIISKNSNTGLIELSCNASPTTGNQTDIFVYYADSIFANNQSNLYISRHIDISCGLNTDAIINNDNANTQNIINSSSSNTQNIINSSSSNTQNIINSSASNTQAIIDSNKENFNDCYTNVLNKNNFQSSYSNGSSATNRGVVFINYYLKKGETYSFSTDISLSTYEYSIAIGRNQWPGEIAQNLLWETGYIRDKVYTFTSGYNGYVTLIVRRQDNNPFGINPLKSYNWQFQDGVFSKFVAYNEEYCVSKLDQQTNAINDLNSSLTDSSSIDMNSLGNTVGWLPAGPIDSIINLPLNFLNAITTAITNSSCSPLDITLPYVNRQVSIPCLSTIFSQIDGLTTFWNWVGRIASIYILYHYLLALWDYYDRLTTMQANFRDDFGGGV